MVQNQDFVMVVVLTSILFFCWTYLYSKLVRVSVYVYS
jgi:hypothetical protein